ncbi:hypothetical protein NPIL_88191, partial [Nephila pilipes]
AIQQCASLLVQTIVLVIRRDFKGLEDLHYAIKFCDALNKTGATTTAMPRKAYGENTISQNMVYSWHKMFLDDREDAEDIDHPGR